MLNSSYKAARWSKCQLDEGHLFNNSCAYFSHFEGFFFFLSVTYQGEDYGPLFKPSFHIAFVRHVWIKNARKVDFDLNIQP